MCLYKELFISFDVSLRQISKYKIYEATNIFMTPNKVLSTVHKHVLQLTMIKIVSIYIL